MGPLCTSVNLFQYMYFLKKLLKREANNVAILQLSPKIWPIWAFQSLEPFLDPKKQVLKFFHSKLDDLTQYLL